MKLKTFLSILCMCSLAPLSINALGSSDDEFGTPYSGESDPMPEIDPRDRLRWESREYMYGAPISLGDELSETGEVSERLSKAHCSNFGELIENLRQRQMSNGYKHIAGEYVYWVNTKLPTENIIQYNKWVGDQVLDHDKYGTPITPTKENATLALLPTPFMLCSSKEDFNKEFFNIPLFKSIIFDASNWKMYRGNQWSYKTKLCQYSDSELKSLDEYINYILQSQPYKQVYPSLITDDHISPPSTPRHRSDSTFFSDGESDD